MNAPNALRAVPPPSASAPEDALVRAIERHLLLHPHAADTAAGVARWWLGVRGIHATAEAIERALAMMVVQRQLRRITLADGSVLYSGPNLSDAP